MSKQRSEIEKLRKEKTKAEAKCQWKEAAAICNCIGQELCKLGEFEEALQYHKEELELCSSQNDKLGMAVSNRRIGECYAELNQFKKALQHLKTFLELANKQQSTVEEQRAWATLGRTYYFKYLHENDNSSCAEVKNQSLDKAEQAYMKALELSVCLKEQISAKEYAEMRSRLLLNLGLVFERRGNLTKCAESIRHAIFLTKKFNLYEDLHRCQYSLASVYQVCGQYNYALRLLDESVSSAKMLHDKTLICEAFSAKANILILLKDFEGARTYLKKAYKLKTPILSDRERIEKQFKLVITLCNSERKLLQCENDLLARKSLFEKMGDALASVECYKVAIEYYLSTLDCLEKVKATSSEKAAIYFSLAQTFTDIGKFDEALEYFWKEVQLNTKKPVEQIKTLWKIAEITCEMRNDTEAEKTLLKALNISEMLNEKKYTYRCLKRLESYYRKNLHEQKILEIEEEIKKLGVLEDENSDESEVEGTEQQFSDVNIEELTDSTDSDIEKELYDIKRPKRSAKRSDSKRNELGETPLHRACISGNLNVVKHLIETGHPVNTRDNCGWLPLHEACNYGYYEIVEYLLMKGALVNDRGGKLCDGITPLHDAAACGNVDVMELLISKGASVTALNNNGESPFDCLKNWWERSKDDLDLETVEQCKTMLSKLNNLMERAGFQVQNSDIGLSISVDINTDVAERPNDKPCVDVSPYPRSQEKRNRSPSLSSEDDNEISYANPHLNFEKNFVFDDPKNAQSEYQAVMSAFRRSTKSVLPSKSADLTKPSALLDENAVVKDWLIQDTFSKSQKTRKKRKLPKHNTHKTNHSIQNFLIKSGSDGDSLQSVSTSSDIVDNNDTFESAKCFKNISVPSEKSSPQINPFSNTNIPTDSMNQLFRLRIHINDKVILIPVPDDTCTMEWLANEAAKRYHNLVGSKPHLSLMNKDGALLSSADIIKTVLQNNEEVMTTVISWEHPSLMERYEQNCQKHNISIPYALKHQLLTFETTCELNFCDIHLSLKQWSSLFLSLSHYEILVHLNLSNDEMSKEVFQCFVNCISSFKSLISLNLSCCGLVSTNIREMTHFLSNRGSEPYLLKLQVFDLSYNAISSENSNDFIIILKLPSLKVLNLTGCGITSSFFLNRTLCDTLAAAKQLKEFNISGNDFDGAGISEMLSFLPRMELAKLDLSHSVLEKIELGNYLQNYMSSAVPALEELNFEGCYLSNEDVLCFIECLKFCPKLRLINVSSNPEIKCTIITNLILCAYQYDVPLKTLIATGICRWCKEDVNELINVFHLKLLTEIRIDSVSEYFHNLLFNAWKDCWGCSAVCINEILCELCIDRLMLN